MTSLEKSSGSAWKISSSKHVGVVNRSSRLWKRHSLRYVWIAGASEVHDFGSTSVLMSSRKWYIQTEHQNREVGKDRRQRWNQITKCFVDTRKFKSRSSCSERIKEVRQRREWCFCINVQIQIDDSRCLSCRNVNDHLMLNIWEKHTAGENQFSHISELDVNTTFDVHARTDARFWKSSRITRRNYRCQKCVHYKWGDSKSKGTSGSCFLISTKSEKIRACCGWGRGRGGWEREDGENINSYWKFFDVSCRKTFLCIKLSECVRYCDCRRSTEKWRIVHLRINLFFFFLDIDSDSDVSERKEKLLEMRDILFCSEMMWKNT